MYVETTDLRPQSLFDRAPLGKERLIAGAVTTLAVHVALPLATLLVVAVMTATGVSLSAPPPPEPPIPPVIQARFLQRGERIDPRQLPNRQVPILRTETPEPAPSRRADTEPPPPRRERQANAVTDLLQRLSDDAQHFAEREERRVQEGDPDGIEGGEREASEGDLYAGRLSQFFRRGWSVPTTLDRDSVQGLTTRVSVRIGTDLRVLEYRLVRGSGNADFDLSVTQQLQRLIDAQASIPEPPSEVAFQYVGREVGFNYRGRDAR